MSWIAAKHGREGADILLTVAESYRLSPFKQFPQLGLSTGLMHFIGGK